MYLLDTDHITVLQRRSEPAYSALKRKLGAMRKADLWIAIISFQESFSGWNAFLNKAKTPADLVVAYQRMMQLLKDFAAAQVAPFDALAAEKASELRIQGVRIATMDLRIASIAITRRWTVVTQNHVDFSRVPGLLIEDWCQ